MTKIIGKIKKFLQDRVVKNAGWIMVGGIAQMLVSLIVGLLSARYLGPSNYGLINYAAAYTTFFTSVCTLGINSVIVREFVEAPEREGTILGTALLLRAVASLLSVVVIIGISLVADADDPTAKWVVALYTIGMLFRIFELFNYWFQSKLQSKTTAIASLIAYTVMAVYKVVLLVTQQSVIYFAFATSVEYICLAALLYLAYKRNGGGKLAFSKQYGRSLLKKSYHFILSGLMIAIYGQTDKIMLRYMIDDAETGYYSTAVAVCSMWCFVLTAIIDSMYPTIMEAFQRDKAEFDKRNKTLYAIVFYLSMGVSLLLTVFGGPVVCLLYGREYLPAVAPLRVVTWYTAFSYLGVARNAWIVCMNRQRCLKYVYCAAAISNVLLNWLLIPLWGATGAAVASLIAQILTAIVVPFFIGEMRENSILMLKAIFFIK